MKTTRMIAAVTMVFSMTAVSDVRYVQHHLASLIQFSHERKVSFLVYDQYDQNRGLAVLSPEKVVDIPTELKSFAKPMTSRAAPSLSPDGSRVAFVQSAARNEARAQQEIWIFDLNSGVASKVAQFPSVLSLTWSPVGDILAVNAGRGQLRTLVLGTKESKLIAKDISSDIASWSPDGHKVTYESASGSGDNRDFHVNVVDVDTGRADSIADGRYP